MNTSVNCGLILLNLYLSFLEKINEMKRRFRDFLYIMLLYVICTVQILKTIFISSQIDLQKLRIFCAKESGSNNFLFAMKEANLSSKAIVCQ